MRSLKTRATWIATVHIKPLLPPFNPLIDGVTMVKRKITNTMSMLMRRVTPEILLPTKSFRQRVPWGCLASPMTWTNFTCLVYWTWIRHRRPQRKMLQSQTIKVNIFVCLEITCLDHLFTWIYCSLRTKAQLQF